jgi:acyl-CoA thioester hydrolase
MNDPDPSAGRFEGRVHLLPVRVYYEDTDFTGAVYHANYLRYFERGRSDFLRLAGIRHAELLEREEPLAFAVLRMEIEFLRPARIDDALLVRTTYEAIRGARFFISQAIIRGREENIARAKVEACCISLTGRPKRPPAGLIGDLAQYFQDNTSTF